MGHRCRDLLSDLSGISIFAGMKRGGQTRFIDGFRHVPEETVDRSLVLPAVRCARSGLFHISECESGEG